MTYTEQAIKIAIENGWRLRNGWEGIRIEELSIAHPNIRYWYRDTPTQKDYFEDVEFAEICLDPLFWQAMGKGLGWTTVPMDEGNHRHLGQRYHEWHYRMHRFIDHLAEGKDIESFFKKLLEN